MDYSLIFERIKQLAKERGTTYTAVEKELWDSTGNMVKWQHSIPRINKIVEVAQYFQVPVDYFITGENFKTLSPDEETLIADYRACNEEGKKVITACAIQERRETTKEKTDSQKESAVG